MINAKKELILSMFDVAKSKAMLKNLKEKASHIKDRPPSPIKIL